MNITSLTSQLSIIFESLFSLHFLYLAGMGLLLTQKKLSEKQYNILMFLGIFSYFLLFYGKYIHIFTMAGDNICQIAYWKILFHPNLTGSIGASYTKPGQLLLLGLLFELSSISGETSFRIGLCLIMAGCIWIQTRIATDIGGRKAGFIALLASSWAFLFDFVAGSFSIFLIPTLYIGLWLYFYTQKCKTLGRLLLALSIQFHIITIAVLGVVWLINLLKKEWRELSLFSLYLTASLTIWALIILRVQGSVTRFSLGTSAGYLPSHDYLLYQSKTEFMFKAVAADFTSNYTIPLLLAISVIGAVGAIYYGYRYYVSIFSTIAFLLVNMVLFGGGINLGRYFSVIYAFSCSVGIGSLANFLMQLPPKAATYSKWTRMIATFCIIVIFCFFVTRIEGTLRATQIQPYVRSASYLLNDPNVPEAVSLMTEDDLLYPIVATAPARFRKLSALQLFNVASEEQRINILRQTDYVWIVLNGEHMYYYLSHRADKSWESDPFRLMVAEILKTRRPDSLYGYRFLPVAINSERVLLKVEHCSNN